MVVNFYDEANRYQGDWCYEQVEFNGERPYTEAEDYAFRFASLRRKQGFEPTIVAREAGNRKEVLFTTTG